MEINDPNKWKEDYNESPGISKWVIIIPILVVIAIVVIFFVFFNSPKGVEKLAVEQQESAIKVTNAGDKPIEKGALKVYLDEKPIEITNNEPIQPGQSITLDLSKEQIKEDSVVRINFGTQAETIELRPIITTASTTSTTTSITLLTTTTLVGTTTTIQTIATTTITSTSTTTTTLAAVFQCPDNDFNCLDAKFANCQRATISTTLGVNMYYEILGFNNSLCGVKIKQIATSLIPEWNGKEMICNLNYGQPFFAATNLLTVNNCQGSLYDALNVKAPTTTYNLQLDVMFPKTIYNVNEAIVNATYFMNLANYNGEPFKGIISYQHSRQGFTKKNAAMSSGHIRMGNFTANPFMQMTVTAFQLNANGYSQGQSSFSENGTYTYHITLYDCLTVEAALNKDCDSVTQNELADSIQPLGTASKTITVA